MPVTRKSDQPERPELPDAVKRSSAIPGGARSEEPASPEEATDRQEPGGLSPERVLAELRTNRLRRRRPQLRGRLY